MLQSITWAKHYLTSIRNALSDSTQWANSALMSTFCSAQQYVLSAIHTLHYSVSLFTELTDLCGEHGAITAH